MDGVRLPWRAVLAAVAFLPAIVGIVALILASGPP
jgi:hypothetical protein